jgi:chemotaxis protein methyltransferase CheR
MSDTFDIELRLLLEAIYLRYHYDFREYAPASVRRRVQQALVALSCQTVSALQEKVLHDAASFTQLLSYLTVQVSDMFRDPTFFKVFRERVVPELRTYPSLRLWVAGCSSGEELFSFAIVLREEGLLDRTILYGTDINPGALELVREGVYALSRVAPWTQSHAKTGASCSLSEHYTAAYGSAKFDRTLLEHAVLSDHSLATDSVFAEVQVVSCRNVLIYFDRSLQDRAVGLFREALCRRGFLGLGARETLRFTTSAGSFSEIPAGEKWYQRC